MPKLKHWPAELLGDRPIADAARLMGMSVEALRAALPELYGRYFPRPDATTGMFDLDAIVRWRQLRHPVLFGLQEHTPQALDPRIIWAERQARKDKERQA